MAAPGPAASPLKQLNQAGHAPRGKLAQSWDDLAHNPALFTTTDPSSSPPDRYFNDFFCLKPSHQAQSHALAALSSADLVGPYKNNISLLFSNAVRILKSAPSADVSRSHVVETLIPLCRDVLSRKFENQSFDTLNVLAGSLERSDQVLTDLVSAIDLTLQDTKVPLAVRHRTLQLALVIVASVNQGSLVAFFLRRDLFSTLVSFIADRETQHFAFEATLLLGLLANYRKAEARNPYGVRIEDFVEEGVMERIIDVVSTVCLRARDSYLAVADDAPASFVATLSSLVWSTLRLGGDFLSGAAGFSLPPPPPRQAEEEEGARARRRKEKGKDKATEEDESEGQVPGKADAPIPTLTINGGDAPPSPHAAEASSTAEGDLSGTDAPAASPPPASDPSPSPFRTSTTAPSAPSRPAPAPRTRSSGPGPGTEETPFAALPPEMLVILVPMYELLNSNKTFCSLVFAERGNPASPPLARSLISLASYLACHASVSVRARLYARLALVLLMILVEEGDGKLVVPVRGEREGEEIRLCRQRHPMLPQRDPARSIPMSAMIDTVVTFLRHNLRKRLDVETYAVALRLLQRIFQQLKTERKKLERDWVIVWRSMLSLASFIVSHSLELRGFSDKVDTLISQLFITLAYAAYWGAQILPSTRAQAELYYELLHADQTLSALSDLLGISSIASPVVNQSGHAASAGTFSQLYNRRDTPTRNNFFALHVSPTKSSFSGAGGLAAGGGAGSAGEPRFGGTGAGFVATECVSNLRSIVTFFSGHINQLRLTKPASDEVEPDEILGVIERELGGVELIESAAMGDLRRYAAEEGTTGGATQAYFRALVEVACQDTLRLMEGEAEA
ncbi:hypothetical protein Rhopal_002767-T1 [Rhodotorula paludigena]|uniref:Armadillo-like helical domain-containing protein n=1 Tax=Rhodotorula paludigena TaxID=86838 RepID=A0AAV5GHQ8_9BASI|nr:hypothetical protein Rhopal_002767-T1 [Rhodotorula paludigena]